MTAPTTQTAPLAPGQIRFYDNYVPPLHDGRYTISVAQTMAGATAQTFSATQDFEVNGPRFSIEAALVHAQFPPPAHSGAFEEQLPQIVLKKRSLPWERYLDPNDPNAPWIGLILLDAGNGATATATVTGGKVTAITLTNAGSGYEAAPAVVIQGGGQGAQAFATIDAAGAVVGITVTAPGSGYSDTAPPTIKLGSTTNAVATTVGDLLSPGKDATGAPIAAPQITLNPDFETTSDPCRIVDIAATIFPAVVPVYDPKNGKDELQFTAHVRQVDTGSKEPLGMATADGWFSVLIAKRFPRTQGTTPNRQIAHLVSFEGYAGQMTGTPDFGGAAMVRLVSLASWTFTCLPQPGETFSQLMNDLVASENQTGYLLKPAYQQPGYTPDGTVAKAQQVLELGYLPMPYQTRQGEHSFAFYRSPLAPVVPPVFADDPPPTAPSAAVIYNKDWGLFDQSYAVAFQTGRLLALSDRSFGSSLLQWRREAHRMVNLLVDRVGTGDITALMQNSNDVATQARALLGPDVVSQGLMAWLAGDVAKKVAPKVSQPTQPSGSVTAQAAANPSQVIKDLQAAMDHPSIQALLQTLGGWDASSGTFSNTRLQQICVWLAELALLQGVPFNNLVPSAAMLPPGAIRFFYIDRNMVHMLIDGAMSVAGQTSRDTLYYAIMRDVIRDAVFSILHQVRQKVMGQPLTPPAGNDGPITGFLLRSAVVSGWPGLEVKGFASVTTGDGGLPEGQDPIPLLRMTRLAKDILLVLFPQTPAWVQIDEPREGLAFGVEDGRGGIAAPVWLRHLVGSDVGAQFGTEPATDAVDAAPAIAATGSIDLLKLRKAMEQNPLLATELSRKPYATGSLSPADFALQMVKLPERMIFQAQS